MRAEMTDGWKAAFRGHQRQKGPAGASASGAPRCSTLPAVNFADDVEGNDEEGSITDRLLATSFEWNCLYRGIRAEA